MVKEIAPKFEAKMPPSIATKNAKKGAQGDKSAFMSLLENLGKTTQKTLESSLESSSNPKTESALNPHPKTPKNARDLRLESQKDSHNLKPQKTPLQSANLTPKIQNIALESSQDSRIDLQDSSADSKQDSPKDSAKIETPKALIDSPKTSQSPLESLLKTPKNAESALESPLESQSESQNEEKPLESPKIAQDSLKDSPKIPPQEILKDSPKDSQNPPRDSTQNPRDSSAPKEDSPKDSPKNPPKLGIKNTLKYGAFAAFDALSLLKPSNGVKISEIIKKADELALNLQSAKFARIKNAPIFAQKIESPKIAPNLKSQKTLESPKIAPQMPNFESPKTPELPKDSSAQNPLNALLNKMDSPKSDSPKTAPDSQKTDSPKLDSPKTDLPKTPQITQDSPKTQDSQKAESPKIAQKLDSPKTPESSQFSANQDANENENPAQDPNIKPVKFKPELQKSTPQKTPESPQNSENTANLAPLQSAPKTANLPQNATMQHFARNLAHEIQSHNPPITRLTLELQPANLGSVEVSIISQGKNLQIQLHASQNTLNLFIQNQSELRAQLANLGYDGVAMSFSNGAQMGFSDREGKWQYFAAPKRNKISLEADDEGKIEDNFEIMLINSYA